MGEQRAVTDLAANSRDGEIVNPLVAGDDLLQRFSRTEPRATMQMAQLCADYCESCRTTEDRVERRHLCESRRCGLLDVTKFNQERLVIAAAMHTLYHVESAEEADIDLLNRHIAQAGSVTMALVRGYSGHYTLGWNAPTLRAAIHAAVVVKLAVNAGDLGSVHARDEGGGRGADETMRTLRRVHEARERWRAAQLAEKGVPVTEIARRLHRPRSEVSRWISKAKREMGG